MKHKMKNFFSRIFNIDFLAAWWIPVVLLILIFSISSCGKEEERPSKQVIEECIENEGYDDIFDYLHQNYSFNEVFNEIVDTYGSERITNEVISNGWAAEIGTSSEVETSRDLNSVPQAALPTPEQTPPVTRSWGSKSSYAQSWSVGTSAPATRATAETPSSEKQDTTVYVTNTGSKYHKSGCQYLRESKIPISLSDAKARGYTPCSKCY